LVLAVQVAQLAQTLVFKVAILYLRLLLLLAVDEAHLAQLLAIAVVLVAVGAVQVAVGKTSHLALVVVEHLDKDMAVALDGLVELTHAVVVAVVLVVLAEALHLRQ
jgi:hypothetical protein